MVYAMENVGLPESSSSTKSGVPRHNPGRCFGGAFTDGFVTIEAISIFINRV